MSISRAAAMVLSSSALLVATGCGAPGLPPAGPQPGEVDVGYGVQDSDKLTGAVTSIKQDEVGNSRPMRVEELLRGKVPGLRIITGTGGAVSYRIRGTNSLLNDRDPLFVVDGVQIPNGSVHTALAGLMPEDIRQVDVLKDVASTAIYGTRGAAGVIIITTRR